MKKKDIEKTAKKMPMMQRWKLPPDGSSSAKMKYLCKGAGMRRREEGRQKSK